MGRSALSLGGCGGDHGGVRLPREVIAELRVAPGERARLERRSTAATDTDWLSGIGRSHPREVAEHDLEIFREELRSTQELLYASDTWAVLVVLQALDAAGKDGTIKHVMSGVNPQGCQVVAFRPPSEEELRHDFLWRCIRVLPARGRIGLFNRSYYEEVLVVRVHPELLAAERLPPELTGAHLWRERFEDINAFERHLVRNGTKVVKLFLHVSREEQRRRLLARLDEPDKRWKFSAADLAERALFEDYRAAYEEALTATSTPEAPWYVVPADHKAAMRALVGGILVEEITGLHLRPPVQDAATAAELDAARRQLLAEDGR